MDVKEIGGRGTLYPIHRGLDSGTRRQRKQVPTAAKASEQRDRVELSAAYRNQPTPHRMEWLEAIREELPETARLEPSDPLEELTAAWEEALSEEPEGVPAAVAVTEEADEADGEGKPDDTPTHSGRVGINAGKLARMLSAAKTRAQVRAVIAQIQADLEECDRGQAQGMDVDEASVEAAERLLQQAQQRMGSAENREATPEEKMAWSLASLM